jgi:hypothetical protein
MEDTTVETMTQSLKTLPQNSLLRSEQDAVQISTPTGEKKNYKAEDALDVALIVIDSLCREMYSPDSMYLAFSAAFSRRPPHICEEDYQELIVRVAERAEKIRKSNPISGMF